MVNTLELEVATSVTYQTWVPPTSHPLLKYSILNVEYSCVATKNLELYIELSQFARAVMTNHRFNSLSTIYLFSFAWEDRDENQDFCDLASHADSFLLILSSGELFLCLCTFSVVSFIIYLCIIKDRGSTPMIPSSFNILLKAILVHMVTL